MALTIGFDATAAACQGAGIGRYTRQLLAALARREDENRYRVFYCAAGQLEGEVGPLPRRFRVRAVPATDRLLNVVWHRLRLPVPVQCLTGRIDLFHSPDFTLPPAPGIPTVLTIHDTAFLRRPDCAYPTLRAYLERVVPHSARRATHVIAVSESTRQDVISLLGVAPERVTTILEGVGEEFRPLDRGVALEHIGRMGISGPYILSVGTLEPRKNYVRLLEAYSRLRAAGAEQRLVIAGGRGWLYQPVFETLASLGLQDHVTFLRPRDADLVALYCAAEVFVYPSLYEGFGIPPLEALACAVPVACSGVSSLPEVVGDAALTFDPEDSDHIYRTIRSILEDDDLRADLRRRGPRRAAHFSWERAACQTVRVYEDVAGGA